MSEPAEGKLAERVRKLVRDRYPATLLWWTGEVPDPRWPSWNAREFGRVAERWRDVARLADGQPEALAWAAHARAAMASIRRQAWRLGHVPFGQARHTLEILERYEELTGVPMQWAEWLAGLDEWLAKLGPLAAGDPSVQASAKLEAGRLRVRVRQLARARGDDRLRSLGDLIEQRLNRNLQKVRGPWRRDVLEPPAWAPLAAAAVNAWRARREGFLPEPRLSLAGGRTHVRPRLEDVLVADPSATVVEVDGTGNGMMVLPGDPPKIVVGRAAPTGTMAADVYRWWFQRADGVDPLTWAIADPIYVEAAIVALWQRLVAERRVEPGRRRLLERLVAESELLAIADAWIWLEGAEPKAVIDWLHPWIQAPFTAATWVHRMQLYPGYFVQRDNVKRRLESEMALGDALAWPGWMRGPVDLITRS